MPLKVPLQQKNLFYTAGFLFIDFIFVVLVLGPLLNSITANSKNMHNLQRELSTLELQRSAILDFRKAMPDIERNMGKIDDLFIDSEAPIGFIDFLERMALANKLAIAINSANIVKQKAAAGKSVDFHLALIGSATDFMRFLSQLENSPYLIDIVDLQVKSEGLAASQQAQIRANLSLRVLAK